MIKKYMCFQYVKPRSSRHVLVALVAFGKLSTENIANTLDKLHVPYIIVLPYEVPTFHPTHIILSGGPKHVYESDHYPLPEWVINSDVPVLGICYGMQLIAHTFGGLVIRMDQKEVGPVEITELICSMGSLQQITKCRWMHRYDQVISLPKMFNVTAVTQNNHIAAFTDGRKWWAVQYHPESPKYPTKRLFKRFLTTAINTSTL